MYEQVDQALLRCNSKSNPEKKQKYVLADEFVKVTKNKEEIRCQLSNAFLAAHDTTAVPMASKSFRVWSVCRA